MMNSAELKNIAEAERHFWWYRGMRGIVFALLDPLVKTRSVRNALEAGCGTGFNALEFQRRYGWNVYPIDLQPEALAYARRSGAARLAQADVSALPFPSGAFDAVISLDVLVYFARGTEGGALAELSRVLKPGGLLVLRVAALEILRSRHSEFTHERQRFTAKQLAPALARYGLRVLRCTYANTLLFPIALAKFRLWEPLLRRPPQSGVLSTSGLMNRLLSVPLATESAWLRGGWNLPLGQSLILIGEKQA